MSQISPPIRIVLAVAVALLVAWMTVLKPKSDVVEPVAPITTGNVATGKPAVSTAGKMAEKAKGVVSAANEKQKAALGESTTQPGGTPPATAKQPTGSGTGTGTAVSAGPLKGVPQPIATAITKQKVLALLFWDGKSAEDRAVHKALGNVDRWDGRVFVKAVPISRIAAYGRIARGVDVQQSPTVVVIDRKLAATRLVGYVDTQVIDQAVVDALRNSGALIADPYLRKVNDLCSRTGRQSWAVPQPNTVADFGAFAKRQGATIGSFVTDFRAIKAPAKYRGFARANATDFAALAAVYTDLGRSLRGNPRMPAIARSVTAASNAERPITKRINARMDAKHVLSCGSNG